MDMTKRFLLCTFSIFSLLPIINCANNSAKRVDPSGPNTVTTVEGINLQDWQDAAKKMSESLLSSGTLGQDGSPDLIAISKFVNDTSQHVEQEMLIKKIRTVLNQSGQAQTITTISGSGEAEDPLAKKQAKKEAFLDEDKEQPEPDYTMTLQIIEKVARAGDTRQAAYVFQMSLTDAGRGVAVWEDSTTIAKQGEQASVGW